MRKSIQPVTMDFIGFLASREKQYINKKTKIKQYKFNVLIMQFLISPTHNIDTTDKMSQKLKKKVIHLFFFRKKDFHF
jgi:hypothetical protein